MLAAFINALTKWIPSLLPKLLTERPDLLVDHALAYAELAKSELQSMKRDAIRRIVAASVALFSGLSFFVLAGMALMLQATREIRTDTAWVLFAVPGFMLALTVIAAVVASTKGGVAEPVKSLTDQVRLDISAFRAAMDQRL